MLFDRPHTEDLLRFVADSPTPYHSVESLITRLQGAGFAELSETGGWGSAAFGNRYMRRGGALIAWRMPEGTGPATPFRIVGAHTDSPGLRIKPQPDFVSCGWRQLGVEIYGGLLLNSVLDRDLGLAGRVVLEDGTSLLIDLHRPLARVPQLAIHLDRSVNDGLTLDRQRHLQPVWGLAGADGAPDEGTLRRLLAAEASIEPERIAGYDLALYDLTAPGFLGLREEFIAAARLDNLVSVHAGAAALGKSESTTAITQVFVAFDHEECGSSTDTGAAGPLLERALARLVAARGGGLDDHARALASSVCLSSDVGHAVHPNYPEKHDPQHHPMPNGGALLKMNVNQRYSTDGAGQAIFAAACERGGAKSQVFVSNNSSPCGSTIGPITATRLGIRTVDIGIAILSMHSMRELAGSDDPAHLAAAMWGFFKE